MKFILLINVKMPTFVGIITFIRRINTSDESLNTKNTYLFQRFSFYEQSKFYAQLSWAWKKLYLLRFFCLVFAMHLCASVMCYVYVPCGHLLGKGWPLGSRLWCLTVSLSLSHWYPGSIRCGIWLYWFLIFAPLLTFLKPQGLVYI